SEFGLLSGGDPKASLKKDYGYTGELTYEALEKTYRLSFYVNLLDEEDNIIGMVLLPCDSSLEYDNFEKYPAHDGVQYVEYPVVNESLYGAYFSIEALEALGYIAKDQNEQKDLCLFVRYTTENMSTFYKYSSNILTYTAEEINSVMDAYEVLR
nr:hypothetical protein [Campylobacterota bacterium]